MEGRLQAVEIWFLRRIFRISWTDHVINEEVLRKAGKERSLMKFIRKRQLQFFQHIMKKEGLENLKITGKIEGKRRRGRQQLTYLESLSKWMAAQLPKNERSKVSVQELLKTTRDRKLLSNSNSKSKRTSRAREEKIGQAFYLVSQSSVPGSNLYVGLKFSLPSV